MGPRVAVCRPVDRETVVGLPFWCRTSKVNFLFVGHEHAGDNLAVLYTLVASCESVGVNPLDYLADVLMRIQTHPADRIDELLPDRWTRPAS